LVKLQSTVPHAELCFPDAPETKHVSVSSARVIAVGTVAVLLAEPPRYRGSLFGKNKNPL
jgi:hypothetical protein